MFSKGLTYSCMNSSRPNKESEAVVSLSGQKKVAVTNQADFMGRKMCKPGVV